MANVGFLRGLQTSIDTILSNQKNNNFANNIVEGAFYLTSDTNRLYIGKKEGENNILASLNAGIVTVPNLDALQSITAEQGVFYYVEDPNILCVRSGGQWVQINNIVTNKTMAYTTSAVTDGAKVTAKLTDSASKYVSDEYSIVGSNGISVTPGTKKITLSADTIEVGVTAETNGVSVGLTSDLVEAEKDTFKIVSGDNTTVALVDGEIKISSVDNDTKVQAVAVNADAKGFTVKVTDTANQYKEGSFTPQIKVGKTAETTVDFVNGIADLDVYTTSQVDGLLDGKADEFASQLKAFNAMEYQGKVETGNALPTSQVKIGYAYLVSGDNFKYPVDSENIYSAGTLIIARGEEDATTGYIKGTITWDFVTGATADTTYKFDASANGIELVNSQNATVSTLGFTAGTDIDLNFSKTSGADQVVTINHAEIDASITDDEAEKMGAGVDGYEIVAVDSITVENGHVTAVNTKTYSVVDTNASLTKNETVVSSVTGGVKVANTVELTSSNSSKKDSKSTDFSLISSNSNLQVSANGNNGVVVNLVWGEF